MKFIFSLLGIRPVGIKRSHPFFVTLNYVFSFYSIRYAIFLIFISLCLFGYMRTEHGRQDPRMQSIRHSVSFIIDPVISTLNAPINWIADQLYITKSYNALRHENEQLRNTLDEMQILKVQNDILSQENHTLKVLARTESAPGVTYKTLRVFGIRSDNYSATLKVQNTAEALFSTQSFAVGNVGLVGRVIDTDGQALSVMLITDSNARIPVRVATSGEQAILGGVTNNTLRVVHAEKNKDPNDVKKFSKLTVGDVFVTSGFGGLYPENIPVGRVTAIEEENIIVTPFENFSTLRFVRVSYAA